jgi:hypothetical protein
MIEFVHIQKMTSFFDKIEKVPFLGVAVFVLFKWDRIAGGRIQLIFVKKRALKVVLNMDLFFVSPGARRVKCGAKESGKEEGCERGRARGHRDSSSIVRSLQLKL